jgi:hypothetical protein
MSFQSLPNELLYMISGQLRRPDLNALAQTCQQFYAFLNSTLYFDNIRLDHSSALFWAASTGSLGTIQRMLAHGADLQIRAESAAATQLGLNYLKSQNMTRKRGSARTRHTRSKKESLSFSACGETLLHRAAEWNQEAVARYLLDNGCDMLSIDMYGYYPIQLAAHRGHESLVRLFLEKGFHPNTLSWARTDPSAIHSAVCGGYSGIVKLLLDHGADANLKGSSSNNEYSPLDLAFSEHWATKTQNILDLQNALGPEHMRGGQENCALLLIDHTAPHEIFEDDRYLLLAVKKNYVKVVQALLDLGIDPNTCLLGRRALRHAKDFKLKELVDLLEPLITPASQLKPKRKKRKTEP